MDANEVSARLWKNCAAAEGQQIELLENNGSQTPSETEPKSAIEDRTEKINYIAGTAC